MSTKLYVGSLPYSTTDAQLTDLFAQYGAVTSAKVITDKFTGQSRGFGQDRNVRADPWKRTGHRGAG